MREEVAQTTVNFSGHKLGAGGSEQLVRLEVGRRIMLRLAQVALGRILEIDRKGPEVRAARPGCPPACAS